MVEHRAVAPGVAGSSPVGLPSNFFLEISFVLLFYLVIIYISPSLVKKLLSSYN